jgi:outer membrane protein assembly factor BamB
MKCHDNKHTGHSPYSTAHIDGTEKWRFETDNWVEGGMVIDDEGTIYFGDVRDYFYALHLNGTLKWRINLGGWNQIISTPTISEDGTIYIGSWDRYLYAIYPNGTIKWQFSSGDSITSSPAIADDGTIYFGIMGPGWNMGRIYAINPNGTEKWHYDTGDYVLSDPAIGDDGAIYFGSLDNYLYALYPNGTLRWRFKTGDSVSGSASIEDDGTLYFGSFDDHLYALYPNGTLKWKVHTGWGTSGNPAIGEDGTIYVGTNKLYAINPDGSVKWTFDLDSESSITHSSPAISADGTIYFGTNIGEGFGGEIIAVNSDGTEKWRKKIANDWIDSSPCIGEDGTVYIGSSSTKDIENGAADSLGYIHAFGTIDSNSPPNEPTLAGDTIWLPPRYVYECQLSSIDPDRNPVQFYVDWGDGTITEWTGGGDGYQKMNESASGETVVLYHAYSRTGEYTIRARARDVFKEESDWTTLDVNITKSKPLINTFLLQLLGRFIEQFPLLTRLLPWGCDIG